MIRETARKYLQDCFAVMVRAIQLEYIFLQHVTKNTECAFTGAERLLQETFLTHLFLRKSQSLPAIVGNLSMILFNKYGMVLQNPVMSADEKLLGPQCARTELTRAVMGESGISTDYQLKTFNEERSEGKKPGMKSIMPT